MKNRITDISQRDAGRVAGLLYLIVAASGIFAEFVRIILIVPEDAGTTANNIKTSEWLFRMGFVSDLILMVGFLLLSLALYVLLKPVNQNLASLMVLFVSVSIPMGMLNLLNQFAVLLLLSGADYLTVFEEDQLYALVMLFLNLYKHGYLIAQIFFGLWLFPLGYLVLNSGYFPRILGILLIISGFSLLINSFAIFLFPSYEVIISLIVLVPAAIGELSFIFWLLLKGAKIPEIIS